MSAPNSVVEIKAGAARPVRVGQAERLAFIAGPCQMESRAHALETAHALKEIAERLDIGLDLQDLVRQGEPHLGSARNAAWGLSAALPVFAEIREAIGLPILTDVHEIEQCAPVAEAVDVLQIPAFLCRQTDLLVAAAKTGRAINVKKGQFLAPWDMKNVIAKITGAGNPNVMACERGVSFGYNTLVSDMRALAGHGRRSAAPWCSTPPTRCSSRAGRERAPAASGEFVPVLARAAVAVGVAAVFMETHPDPDNAPSDGPNMVPLAEFEALAAELLEFDALAKRRAR